MGGRARVYWRDRTIGLTDSSIEALRPREYAIVSRLNHPIHFFMRILPVTRPRMPVLESKLIRHTFRTPQDQILWPPISRANERVIMGNPAKTAEQVDIYPQNISKKVTDYLVRCSWGRLQTPIPYADVQITVRPEILDRLHYRLIPVG